MLFFKYFLNASLGITLNSHFNLLGSVIDLRRGEPQLARHRHRKCEESDNSNRCRPDEAGNLPVFSPMTSHQSSQQALCAAWSRTVVDGRRFCTPKVAREPTVATPHDNMEYVRD